VETEELGGRLEEVERFHVFIPLSLRLLDRVQHNHTNDLTARGLPVDVHAALVREIEENTILGPKALHDKVISFSSFVRRFLLFTTSRCAAAR
jgi:hypothetical protein